MIKTNYDKLTPGGKINFAGIVARFFDIIIKNVKLQSTKDSYSSLYNNVILKFINLELFVEDLTFEYIANIKNTIVEQYNYTGSTIDKVWMLLTKPINIYYEQIGMPNKSPFIEVDVDEAEQEKEEVLERCKKIIKSLSPAEELDIICYLFEHIEEGGEVLGQAIMYFFKIRENEVCGTVFGNYKEMQKYKECHFLDAGIVTTGINTNNYKSSGKNKNSPRSMVGLELFNLLYEKRKNFVKKETGNDDISTYPMACRGNNFEVPCSTQDLSRAGKRLLQDTLKINGSDYDDLEYMLKYADVFFDVEEKTPTTYLFRRNSATRSYYLNYSITQIQNSMGHRLTESLLPKSSFYDEETLHKMWLLEQQHPLNLLIDGFVAPVIMDNVNKYTSSSLDNSPNSKLISIKGREFNDPITVDIECDEAVLYDNTFYDFPSKYVNILEDIYEEYVVKNSAKWHSAKKIVNK